MALSLSVRNYVVRKWYMEELGRVPSGAEQAEWSKKVESFGPDTVFAQIYDSAEGKAHRKLVGRTI